jgi:hypothetical protein
MQLLGRTLLCCWAAQSWAATAGTADLGPGLGNNLNLDLVTPAPTPLTLAPTPAPAPTNTPTASPTLAPTPEPAPTKPPTAASTTAPATTGGGSYEPAADSDPTSSPRTTSIAESTQKRHQLGVLKAELWYAAQAKKQQFALEQKKKASAAAITHTVAPTATMSTPAPTPAATTGPPTAPPTLAPTPWSGASDKPIACTEKIAKPGWYYFGKYEGRDMCMACRKGKASAGCKDCNPDPLGFSCITPCGTGKYITTNEAKSSECKECPAGKWQPLLEAAETGAACVAAPTPPPMTAAPTVAPTVAPTPAPTPTPTQQPTRTPTIFFKPEGAAAPPVISTAKSAMAVQHSRPPPGAMAVEHTGPPPGLPDTSSYFCPGKFMPKTVIPEREVLVK